MPKKCEHEVEADFHGRCLGFHKCGEHLQITENKKVYCKKCSGRQHLKNFNPFSVRERGLDSRKKVCEDG